MLQVELHLKHEVKLLKEESTQHNIIQLVVKPTRKEVEAPPPLTPLLPLCLCLLRLQA